MVSTRKIKGVASAVPTPTKPRSRVSAPTSDSDSDDDDDDDDAPAAISFSTSKSSAKQSARTVAATVSESAAAKKDKQKKQTLAKIERNIKQKDERRARLAQKGVTAPAAADTSKQSKQDKKRLPRELSDDVLATLLAEEDADTGDEQPSTSAAKQSAKTKTVAVLGADRSQRIDACQVVRVDHGIGAVVMNDATVAEPVSGLLDSTRSFLKDHFYGARVVREKPGIGNVKAKGPSKHFGAAAKKKVTKAKR